MIYTLGNTALSDVMYIIVIVLYIYHSLVLLLQSNLNTRDFADLSAPLLYNMFKAHTDYPLHLAIQHKREDVVFLFLIEYNSQVSSRVPTMSCSRIGRVKETT